jgi:hypothetical protein
MVEAGDWVTEYTDLNERLRSDGWQLVPKTDTEWTWVKHDSQGRLIGWEGSERYYEIRSQCKTERVWRRYEQPREDHPIF